MACVALLLSDASPMQNAILPPDVVDVSLAVLCAPLIIVTQQGSGSEGSGDRRDFECWVAHFRSGPVVSTRIRTTDHDTLERLRRVIVSVVSGSKQTQQQHSTEPKEHSRFSLTVYVELDGTVAHLPDAFMTEWVAVTEVDMRRTAVTSIGNSFLQACVDLTSVKLPDSLCTVESGLIAGCDNLERVDLRNTSLQRVGDVFLSEWRSLTSIELPACLREVGVGFVGGCWELPHIDLHHTSISIEESHFRDASPLPPVCGDRFSRLMPQTRPP